jgi:hypothetical protein
MDFFFQLKAIYYKYLLEINININMRTIMISKIVKERRERKKQICIKYFKEFYACIYKYFTPFNSSYRYAAAYEPDIHKFVIRRNLEITFRLALLGYSFDSKAFSNFYKESLLTFNSVLFSSNFPNVEPVSLSYKDFIKKTKKLNGYQCLLIIDDTITTLGDSKRVISLIEDEWVLKSAIKKQPFMFQYDLSKSQPDGYGYPPKSEFNFQMYNAYGYGHLFDLFELGEIKEQLYRSLSYF